MKKEKKDRSWFLSSMIILCLVIGIIGGIGYNNMMQLPKEKHIPRMKINMDWLGEYNNTAGASEWSQIFAYPHQESPESVYNNNDTETLENASLAWADTDGWSDDLISETAFDIVIRCRFNRTHIYDTDHWDESRARVYLNATGDITLSGDLYDGMNATANDTAGQDYDFCYINFWWNNSDSGYQITDGGTITIPNSNGIVIEAKY